MTIKTYYAEGYFCAGYGVDTREKARDIAESLRVDRIDGIELVEPEPVPRDQLMAVHSRAYVDAFLSGTPEHLADRNGLGPWSRELRDSVLLSTGGIVQAVETTLLSRSNAGSLSSGLHHARKASGAGFCTINGLVVAARRAVALGAVRVLIVDFDAHCGGGTASLIEGDDHIEQIDVAVSSYDTYISTRNARLQIANGENYLDLIRDSLASVILPESVSVVIYNAGMDPHENCSTGGVRGVTTEVLAERESLLFEWARSAGIPVAFALAGGYSGRSLTRGDLVNLHRLTLREATM